MPDSVRKEFEAAVREWLQTKDEKAEVDAAFNEILKKAEKRIRVLAKDLTDDASGQQRLPLEDLAADAARLGVTGAERKADGSTVVHMGDRTTVTIPRSSNPVLNAMADAGEAVEAQKASGTAYKPRIVDAEGEVHDA
jgi:hypothetical protein